jgi:hypothetical protein
MRVPRRPCLAVARQQARVGVQHHLVGLVADRPQDAAFDAIGVGEQRQRLVAMAGHHDLVEALQPAGGEHAYAMFVALHPQHRAADALAHVPAPAQRLDVLR